MFTVTCPTRGRVLMSESSIVSLRNAADGITMSVECYCGERHTVRSGRAHARTRPRVAADL